MSEFDIADLAADATPLADACAVSCARLERAACSMCGKTIILDWRRWPFCSDRCSGTAMEYAHNILRQAGWTEDETSHSKSPPVSLYRHFDQDGALLYVGISLNAVSCLSAHRRSPWSNRIARIEVESHPTREAALAAELAAIRNEKPLHNIVGRVAA
jgi:hypothetical protein